MKIRTTKKAIRVAYSNIICLSYCSLRALDYLDADYYGTRCEGWAFDAYIISNDTVIVTGYAPFGNVKPTYTVIENYNKKLVPIVDKYRETVNYERFISEVQELVKAFAVEVTDRVCPF